MRSMSKDREWIERKKLIRVDGEPCYVLLGASLNGGYTRIYRQKDIALFDRKFPTQEAGDWAIDEINRQLTIEDMTLEKTYNFLMSDKWKKIRVNIKSDEFKV